MIMNCDECGKAIFVGDEYMHDSEEDKNYHLGDCNFLNEDPTMPNEKAKRYREE